MIPNLRQPPVEQNDFAKPPHQNVLRLDVPVEHPFLVRKRKGIGNLLDDVNHLCQVIALSIVEQLS